MKILNVKTVAGVLLALSMQGVVHADTIDTLFNTGVDNFGNQLGDGMPDNHYQLADFSNPVVVPFTVPAAYPFPFWVANQTSPTNSSWIGYHTTSADADPGNYFFRTFFTLPVDTILSSVMIAGMLAVDNNLGGNGFSGIYLNGSPVWSDPVVSYGALAPFVINSSFQTGSNFLDFVVLNGANPPDGVNPMGIQIQFTEKSYTTTPAPTLNNVTFLTLLMLALGTWGLVSRRQKT